MPLRRYTMIGDQNSAQSWPGFDCSYESRHSGGGRFVDQLVGRVAHESKVGYTSLTKDIAGQIAKDAELILTKQIDSAVWHFYQSPVTGLGGPSGPLREALSNAGIGFVIH
jgi:filamentous hemagglutinin